MTDVDQFSISIQTLYIISLCTIKLSILLFYNRIFGIARPMFRYILLATGGVVIAYSVAGILGTVLQCIPLSNLWKPRSETPLRCIRFGTLVLTGTYVRSSDFLILDMYWILRQVFGSTYSQDASQGLLYPSIKQN